MMTGVILLTVAVNDATHAGRACGSVFLPILTIAAVLRCAQIMRRPEASTRCVLSLTLVFAAWMLLTSITASESMSGEKYGPWVMTPTVVIALGMIIAALVMGIVGLVNYGKHQPPYWQGRGHAIWGIALSIVTMALLALGVGMGIARARDRVPTAAVAVSSGEQASFADLNFRLTVPSSKWSKLNPKTFNEDATVLYIQTRPSLGFAVIAEKDTTQGLLNTDALADIAVANLKGAATNVVIHRRDEREYAGLRGQRLVIEAHLPKKKPLGYVFWVLTHRGYAYQLITWGEWPDVPPVEQASDDWCRAFSLIDPNATGDSQVAQPLLPVHRPGLGYAIHYPAEWSPWVDLREDFVEAIDGARLGVGAFFGITAVDLQAYDPTLHDLTTAMIKAALEADYPDDSISVIGPVEQSDATGRALQMSRTVGDTPVTFRLRVLRRGSMAYLLSTWRIDRWGMPLEQLDQALDAVTFTDPQGPPPSLTQDQLDGQAQAINTLALARYRARDYKTALALFQRAFSLAPQSSVYLRNVAESFNQLGQYADAASIVEQHIQSFPDDQELLAKLAYSLGEAGRLEDAVNRYLSLFASDYFHEDYADDYVAVLIALDRSDEAMVVMDRFVTAHPTRSMRIAQAHRLEQLERYDQAIACWRKLLDEQAYDPDIAYELADTHHSAGRYAEALKIVDDLIDRGHGDADAWGLKGYSEYDLKWYPAAKASFETALSKDPTHKRYRSYLDHVAGLLGQGDNSAVRQPIDAVPVPEPLRRMIDEARRDQTWTPAEGYGAYIDESIDVHDYDAPTELRWSRHCRIVITDKPGIERYSTLEFHFDPLGEDLYINDVRVLDSEGKLVAQAARDSFFVVDDSDAGMASQDKVLNVPVPGLAVGHVLDYTATWRTRPAPQRFGFLRQSLSNSLPTRVDALAIHAGDTPLHVWTGGSLQHIETSGLQAWMTFDPPLYRYEPTQLRPQTFQPTVIVNARGVTWEQLAAEYLKDIEARLAVPQTVRDLASQLTQGKATPQERYDTIARYVQRDYTYKAIEFGRRARVPNATDQIVRDRYGDCKDHALLLTQLLNSADIRAHLALTDTGGRIERDMPSLDQFDHMVVYVHEVRGGTVVDPTDKDHPVTRSVPAGSYGDDLFILDPDQPRIMSLPDFVDDTSLHSRRAVRIVDDADAVVDETVRLDGYYAGPMRAWLIEKEAHKRPEVVRQWLGDYGVRVDHVEITGLDDPADPVVLTLRYTAPDAFAMIEGRLVGSVPAVLERDYLEMRSSRPRQTPFRQMIPLHVTSQVTLQLPSGYRADPPPGARGESDFASWGLIAASDQPGQIRFDYECRKKTGLFPADRYEQCRTAFDEALRPWRAKLILTPEP